MNVNSFLLCATPDAWLAKVESNLSILLIDHANCEKKAASTALNLMYRYVDMPDMLLQLSKLAREELRHFEQVVGILKERGIVYEQISSSRYAGELRQAVRTHDPERLIDILIVSAIVEARSCERFGQLIDCLDSELARFYQSLLVSESRHFTIYLRLAEGLSKSAESDSIDFAERVDFFLEQDRHLITSDDQLFRFHSGVPAQQA